MCNLYFTIVIDDQPIHTSFVPLAIYVHDKEFTNIESHLENMVKELYKSVIGTIYTTSAGDYYQSKRKKEEYAYTSRIDKSVIVMGAFDGGERENELEEIKNYLNMRDYSANLIKDLPGHPARPPTHKAKTYGLTSRFCVIVDIDASGHLIEYSDLKGEKVPIALLRKEGCGSTWMIGPDYQTDDYIELFEFQDTPLEVMEEVTSWAEEFTDERIEGLDEYYPAWKNSES